MKVIGFIDGEGFRCDIKVEVTDGMERVEFTADADIDADGANGQHGAKAAYMLGDVGSEALANGGMMMRNGRVVGKEPWFRDIVILGPDNQPKVFPGGIVASTTWYRHLNRRADDPTAYVDSETVAYIVVPPLIIQRTKGIVRGCKARATHMVSGLSVNCVVADKGPRHKIGEVSIEAARRLGIPSSPRSGGTNKPIIKYELWPGLRAPGYVLQRA